MTHEHQCTDLCIADPSRAVQHEHWTPELYSAQATIRNQQGEKVAIVPTGKANADTFMRRYRLVVHAPEMERVLVAALRDEDTWRETAVRILRATGGEVQDR